MRLWPFKYEVRQLPGGDSSVNTALGVIDAELLTGGIKADVNKTAAVEFALSMVARAFMFAEPVPAVPALTPLTMSMIARQTISLGNAVFELGVSERTRALRLMPVAGYKVVGEPEPETWRYELNKRRPRPADDVLMEEDKGVTSSVSWDGVVHVRYMPRSSAPWHGVSPLIAAGLTSDELAKIERSLSYDAGPAAGMILAIPDGVGKVAASAITADLSQGLGKINFVETTRGGFGQGQGAAPEKDWEQKRFGALVPEANINLRDKTALWVLAAMGIPPSLFTSEGSALRESYRHFFTNTVEPLGRLIAEELSDKLEQDISFMFPEVFKSDISARSRAYSTLVQSGMDAAEAKTLVGFPA